MITKKQISTTFLKEAATGDVDAAFEKYVHPDFIHHNAHFKGDRESLRIAMKDNQGLFPDKSFEVLRALEDGDLTAVHGRVKLSEDQVWAVIHLFKFKDNKIVELWEGSQQELEDMPNEEGVF